MSEQMPSMSEAPGMDVSSDDKLWVLLTYVLTPIVPIILMLMEDKKNRPFIRAHNAQALALGLIQVILGFFSWTLVTLCLNLLLWIACIYWGLQGYNGKLVNIPVITDFVKKQGWA